MLHTHTHPHSPHHEEHFEASDSVRDVVIGMADGLTVPFALAAGLSGALDATQIVITAGLAEIAAGSIAMGLGGYLAARSEAEHYDSELAREYQEIKEKPEFERAEVREILIQYGLAENEANSVVAALEKRPDDWVEFMMRFELGLDKPEKGRALQSALTIGGAYIVGGMIPLTPFMLMDSTQAALPYSIGATGISLIVFGWIKGVFTGTVPWRSSAQTTLIGGLAAATAYFVARLISQ